MDSSEDEIGGNELTTSTKRESENEKEEETQVSFKDLVGNILLLI
jgi:hypothetical protein